MVLGALLLTSWGALAQPAMGGTGNSVVIDPVGDAFPPYVDIILAKITQQGNGQISFTIVLATQVMPNKTALYAWFIDKAGTNNGLLNPGDFSVNLVFNGTAWTSNLTKATIAGQPILGAVDTGVRCSFAVLGSTVRVMIPSAALQKLNMTDPTFSVGMFHWWAVTRYGSLGPPNADRAPDAPPLPGTALWAFRDRP